MIIQEKGKGRDGVVVKVNRKSGTAMYYIFDNEKPLMPVTLLLKNHGGWTFSNNSICKNRTIFFISRANFECIHEIE